MATPNIEPVPPATVWPPAPLHAAVSPPLFVSAEGIEVTQSGGCLIVLNKPLRRSMLMSASFAALPLAMPFIACCIPAAYHFLQLLIRRHMLAYIAALGCAYLLIVFEVAIVWSLFYFRLSLGSVVLDKITGTVRVNGRLRPMSAIGAIQVRHVLKKPFPTDILFQLVWKQDEAMPDRKKFLKRKKPRTSFLGAVRQEENAEKIAAAVAEFANVPVQHWTR